MKRLNILVLTLLARGHVYPVLPLCHELAERGHRVVYATNNNYVDDIQQCGAHALAFQSLSPANEVKHWWNGLANVPFDNPGWFSPPDEWIGDLYVDTASLHTSVQQFFASDSPDIVLYDKDFYPGCVVARRLGCPRVRISPHFASYKNFLIRRNGVCKNTEILLAYASRVNQFFLQEDVDTDGSIWPLEDLNVHLIPDAFQYHRASFDERYCFAGHSMNRPFPRRWTTTHTGDPLVLISGFSGLDGQGIDTPKYLRTVVEALADSEFHCILLSEYEERSVSLPVNFDACPGVSPLEVLPHADVFVCHGGMGSTLEAIYTGVPVLAIPAHPSADEIAYRVAELGVGLRMLTQDVSAENVRETIATLAWDKGFSERVKDLRTAFECSAGVSGACDRIEQLLEASGTHSRPST